MSSFAATPATESGAGPRRHPTRWWAAQWLMLALTAAVLLALFELTDIDRQLTQVFYDPAARAFPLRQHWFFDAVLHRGAKQASYLLVVACLWLCWRGWRGELSWLPPRNALLAALGMLLIPLTTTLLKHATNRYCPWDIVDFGGFAPYSGLLHALPPGLRPGQCFPAGHSSAGFLWLVWALALRPAGPLPARAGLAAGVVAGLVLGLARMAQGAHFLSHTVWTLWLAWVLCLLLAWAVGADLRLPRPVPAKAV
jgi:membrane-associated PAP2 superfamily phosphatase